MNKVSDLDLPESEKSQQSQQEGDPVSAKNLPLPGTLDQGKTLGSMNGPCVPSHLGHFSGGKAQKSPDMDQQPGGPYVGFETPAAFDPDGPKWSEVLSGDGLAREPLLNEHFNKPLPQRSQHTVSRTEVTDGETSRVLGPTCQECVSSSSPVQNDSCLAVDECPICTESYQSRGDRSMVLLNCDHGMCQRCLAAMLRRAADCSRVQCPLCRQKTPLLQWEICRLQEDTAFSTIPPDLFTAILVQSEPEADPALPDTGLCSALERHLLLRAETARVCGCFGHPRWLVQLVRRMQYRCSCCCITLLIIMYLAEMTFLLLVFLPVVVLVLLFTLAS